TASITYNISFFPLNSSLSATSSLSVVFFFSSRRRHTRSKRDWSSDVCSSDLLLLPLPPRGPAGPARRRGRGDPLRLRRGLRLPAAADRARTDRQRAQRARDRALGPGLLLRRALGA